MFIYMGLYLYIRVNALYKLIILHSEKLSTDN
jgi:hypothetical protein